MVDEAGPRERILAAALRLLAEGGRDAVSTRAVSAEAGVQAPTLYRLFGDKQGLLDAVAHDAFVTYLADKTARPRLDDPVDDLREGFDLHVAMGLAHPALYGLMYADPSPGTVSPAAVAGWEMLAGKIHRVAEAGRLRVGERLAAELVHAVGRGVTLTLVALPGPERDPALTRQAREAVLAALTTDVPVTATAGPVGAAVALRAVLDRSDALSGSEQALMTEWLDRIVGAG